MGKSSAPASDYEIVNHVFDEFDPRLHFSKFLEEAKHHATEQHLKSEEETRKSKKSWKNTLFSWLKSDKKSNPPSQVKPDTNCHIPRTRRVHVSGPIYSGAKVIDGRNRRRPTSGPIASLFTTSKGVETEIPYMCLDQLTSPNIVASYGPVYLVT